MTGKTQATQRPGEKRKEILSAADQRIEWPMS